MPRTSGEWLLAREVENKGINITLLLKLVMSVTAATWHVPCVTGVINEFLP